MALTAAGLQTAIWNNNAKSLLLLVLYPFLLAAVLWAFFFVTSIHGAGGTDIPIMRANAKMLVAGPWVLLGLMVWFVIAYVFHQRMINAATGARALTREEAPMVYNLLENLCISRGLRMPSLFIIDSNALNAYASGVDEGHFAITLTSGIVEQLTEPELEAVIAHELTHIMNRDVRLLMVAVIFVGIFATLSEMTWRLLTSRHRYPRSYARNNRPNNTSGGRLFIMLLLAVVLAVGYGLSLCVRFALSRRREFLADAGAVQLTKNPTALIAALRKISGKSDLPAKNDEVKQMYIENRAAFLGLFATHPPIEERIGELMKMGGQDLPLLPEQEHESPQKGPWA